MSTKIISPFFTSPKHKILRNSSPSFIYSTLTAVAVVAPRRPSRLSWALLSTCPEWAGPCCSSSRSMGSGPGWRGMRVTGPWRDRCPGSPGMGRCWAGGHSRSPPQVLQREEKKENTYMHKCIAYIMFVCVYGVYCPRLHERKYLVVRGNNLNERMYVH